MASLLAPRLALGIAAVLAFPAAAFAQLSVVVSGGIRTAYEELLPEFEKTTGITVTTTAGASIGTGPNTIANQLRRGVAADVVLMSRPGLSGLIAEGRILPGTDVDLAESGIGAIVPAGSPRPDISTVLALKRTLLRARSVAVSKSVSGVYLTTTLFPKLGVAEAMAGKLLVSDAGAAVVGTGAAEIGFQQIAEVLRVPGADFVGPIPAEVQLLTVYAAGIVLGSKNVEASRQLIALLSSAHAAPVMRKSGMEPAKR